ncbi:hypothetical protein [Corynebacterium glutamicum]|uniref:Uncharacterized protein n=2 Tax=Corynebacterium glutamicum TaxID=1718 RepID=Q5KRJ1_CORGT|nr:hypothetical protein [Corynebacterium glutamicum]BAD84090.1 hypothetical protein [Corynebacterium glutamicum]BAF54882.1 hypothetical protein cgR_1887 [Corynebacterium glutamicum R]
MAKDPEIILDLPDDWFQDALKTIEPALDEVAGKVADSITGVEVTVTARDDRDGRPVRLVTLAEAKGAAMQAKHGTLTRAAARQSLDVVRYSPR